MHFFTKLTKTQLSLILVLSLVLLFAFAPQVFAQTGTVEGWFLSAISKLLGVIIWFMGWLITLVISGIIYLAQYNDFIDSQVVVKGWVIIRDLCNMFFILILLVVAFTTVLGIDGYPMKKLLPKVVIAAIFINFSKSICGIILDASSVVMLTFVNGFSDFGGAKLTQVLGIDKMLSLSGVNSNLESVDTPQVRGYEIDGTSLLLTYLFAFAYLLVAGVVLISMLFMLLWRIIMIWIYVTVSPFAWLAYALPSSKYYSKWWGDFTNAVVSGPVLAFFIWLSLSTLDSATSSNPNRVASGLLGNMNNPNPVVGISEISGIEFFIGYIVAIALLVGGLIVSKSYGGLIGGAAVWGMGQLKAGSGWIKKKGKSYGSSAAKLVGKGALGVGTAGVGAAKFADSALFKGAGSRGLGFVKDNLNLQGLKRTKDALAMNTWTNANSEVSKMRQSIGNTGSWMKNGVKYQKNAEGKITADGKSLLGLNPEEAKKLLPTINGKAVEVKAMSEWAARGLAGWQARPGAAKARAEDFKKDKDEIEKTQGLYKHLATEAELETAYRNTGDVKQRLAIGLSAKDKGYTATWFNSDADKYKKEREVINKEEAQYSKLHKDKIAAIASMTASELETAFASTSAVSANFDAKNFKSTAAADQAANQNLAERYAIQQKMMETGAWDAYLRRLGNRSQEQAAKDEAASMAKFHGEVLSAIHHDKIARLDDVNHRENTAQQKSFNDFASLAKYRPALYRDLIDGTAKTRPDLIWDMKKESDQKAMSGMIKKGKLKLDELKVNHMDANNLAEILSAFKGALDPGRYNAAINKIDTEGSKDFAGKIADASLLEATKHEQAAEDALTKSIVPGLNPADKLKFESEAAKALKESQSYRTHYVALKGDLKKAFTGINGVLDESAVKKFIQSASAKQLEQIDSSELDDRLADILSNQVSSSKLEQLNRQDNNPGLVNTIIERWAKYNHPESLKALNMNSSIVINVKTAKHNKAIVDFIRQLKSENGGSDPSIAELDLNNIKAVNDFSAANNLQDTNFKKGKNGSLSVDKNEELARKIRSAITNGTWGK